MFEFITEDFADEILAGNVQDDLYDMLGQFSLNNLHIRPLIGRNDKLMKTNSR